MNGTGRSSVRRAPRWFRRALVGLRRANFLLLLELTCAAIFVLMLSVSWLTLSGPSAQGGILPSRLTSSLLIGTLVPARALLVLAGRRLAIRRAAKSVLGSSGRLHVRLV